MIARCDWVPDDDELSIAYHDNEWGIPEHNDRKLFEALSLEGAQAGLSWRTILAKRDGYRRAFADFDPAVVAAFDSGRVDHLAADPSIVRHRQKIESVITNAAAIVAIQTDGTFDGFVWSYVGDDPVENRPLVSDEIPARTELSTRLAQDLKKHGFRFVGPTTVYAFMQAVGMVNDHTRNCFRAGTSPV